MEKLPSETIGETYTSTFGWELLNDLSEIQNRMAGHPGEQEAADHIAEAFRRAGADSVTESTFEIVKWERGTVRCTTTGGLQLEFKQPHQIIALPHSPTDEVHGEIVDMGPGLPDDFEETDIQDAIVVVSDERVDSHRYVSRNEKYARACTGGAAGFVFWNTEPGCLPPTGTIGVGDATPARIVGAGASREVGKRLAKLAERQEATAKIATTCEFDAAMSRNVEAVLGPDSASEVLVTGHMDAHDIAEGATDNGVGCAVMLEICRTLSSIESELETSVRFIAFGAEEVGFHGSHHWVDEHDLDSVKAVVNIDTAGTGRTLKAKTNAFDDLEDIYTELGNEFEIPIAINNDVKSDSDHWPFVSHGVPAITANSVDSKSGRGWGHTHADTVDKLDIRDLRANAVLLANSIRQLARDDVVVQEKTGDQMRALIGEAKEEALRVTGKWPWDQ